MRCQRFGTRRNGLQRFRCPQCKKTYTEEHKHLIEDMNLADEGVARPSTLRRRQLAAKHGAASPALTR
jgi:transposase-like protein